MKKIARRDEALLQEKERKAQEQAEAEMRREMQRKQAEVALEERKALAMQVARGIVALVLAGGVLWWGRLGCLSHPNNKLQFANRHRPGETKTIILKPGNVTMDLVWCPPGVFMMGSPETEQGRSNDERLHQVTLTKGFWMSKTEVTQAQWESVMGTSNRPSYFRGAHHPVESVSWNDCVEFCMKAGNGLRLPTETEWEYACRAGSSTALPNGEFKLLGKHNAPALDSIAWYSGNASVNWRGTNGVDTSEWGETQYPGGMAGTHAVGTKKPNKWGLSDMLGNVSEWCDDWYGAYPTNAVKNPRGEAGIYRVHRGGAWGYIPQCCRSANRGYFRSTARGNLIGFRPCSSAEIQ